MSVTTESPGTPAPPARPQAASEPRRVGGGLLDPKILLKSTPDAFKKLDPRVQIKNPVMFVVEVGAVLTLYTAIRSPSAFNWTIVVWLWLTVVFANLAEAVAEGRGKAQAETLRRAKRETMARRLYRLEARGCSGFAARGVRARHGPDTRRLRGGRGRAGHPR